MTEQCRANELRGCSLLRFVLRPIRLHDHPLDAVNQFECAALAEV
jgi:hypothetical protein